MSKEGGVQMTDRRNALDQIAEALNVAKLYAIRYPHPEAAKIVRCMDNARCLVIELAANLGLTNDIEDEETK